MIILTKHARIRMKERRILKRDLENVLSNPDKIQRESSRVTVSKKINEKRLEAVYVIENHNKIILTCYYL